MAWTSPFYKSTPNTRRHYGLVFEWTDDHLSVDQLKPLRYTYDTLADDALKRLEAISPAEIAYLPGQLAEERSRSRAKSSQEIPAACPLLPKRDLYALLRDNAASDPVLGKLWTQINTIPPWVDWDQIARGQDVFYRYASANLTGLAYQSLLGGMGAARVVEVLARTGGFSTKVAKGRLFETTQHILQCTRTLEGILPGGEGFQSTVRVRFLHAAVRRRILKLAGTRPDYYSVEEYGVPVNDLDCAATISVFSATLIWMSLPRQGIWMRPQEIEDYLALWRYIGHVIGAPTECFSTPAKAKALYESLFYNEVHPSDISAIMANNIIRCIANTPPAYTSAEFLSASARWLNGNELGDALQLMRPSFYYTLLMAGQCVFFSAMIRVNRAVPSWDRRNLAAARRLLWQFVVVSRYGLDGSVSGFDFRYVPEYDTVTEMGTSVGGAGATRPIEMRNLRTLVIAGTVLFVGAWVGVKVTAAIFRAAMYYIW